MGVSQFSVSAGAAAWLERYFDAIKGRPATVGMAPALIHSAWHESRSLDGDVLKILGRVPLHRVVRFADRGGTSARGTYCPGSKDLRFSSGVTANGWQGISN